MLINVGEKKTNECICDVKFEILSNILKNEKEMLFDGDMQ